MEKEIFKNAKDAFLDLVNDDNFIKLDRIVEVYESLKISVKKPLKLILLYGEPGTGKSMLLKRLHKELKNETKIFLYLTPIVDEVEFFSTLAHDIYDQDRDVEFNFSKLNMLIAKNELDKTPIILLDEAQLYGSLLMEKIRLLADSRKIKFVITLHKTKDEDLIAKGHFQTRIWQNVVLTNATLKELNIYIQKKLLNDQLIEVASMFDKNNIKLIHSFTSGNLRDTNKLLFSLFEIYDYYDNNQPSKIDRKNISTKFIEMAAIRSGFIDA
jgi:4-hydroxy-tetrahydrodipicolinate synthase